MSVAWIYQKLKSNRHGQTYTKFGSKKNNTATIPQKIKNETKYCELSTVLLRLETKNTRLLWKHISTACPNKNDPYTSVLSLFL